MAHSDFLGSDDVDRSRKVTGGQQTTMQTCCGASPVSSAEVSPRKGSVTANSDGDFDGI